MTLLQNAALYVALPLLCLGMAFILARLIQGPTLADRVVALDLLAVLGIGCLAAYAILTQQVVFLDIAAILGLLSFLGTVAFAVYLERRLNV